ncbi:MAG: ATP-binding cassette domain-containing protein [Planctomycetota bacterium]
MIEIEDLTRRFGTFTAVDGVRLSVPRGQVLGFLGPNGAGKSTTMRMVTGFLPPTSGTARLDGHDVITDTQAAQRVLGYLPEGAPAYPDMTPRGFLDFVGEVRGLSKADRKRRTGELAERISLGGVLDQPIDTLSKGFRRRVGLAQALIHDPDILIMDEPTDGLDPNQKHEVRELIRSMADSKAIVLSTHILEEVEAVCDRAVIINRGRLEVDGTPEELLARSERHGAVRLRFTGAVPADASSTLDALEPVKRVVVEGDSDLLAIPANGQALLEPVAQIARERSWPVGEVLVERGRLDEVFRDVTSPDSEVRA